MEIPTITVETRKASGSRAAARLRKQGKLPAIVYGHGEAPMPITLDYHDVEQHLKHGLHVVNLNMGSKTQPCQFKDAQYDHLGIDLVHVDLVRVDLSERVRVTVPIDFRGTPTGVGEGGIFRHDLSEIEVECLVTAIPETIRVDVSGLGLNQVLHVKEIALPDGVSHVLDAEKVVAAVRLPSTAVETVAAPAEGGPAEPEVIAKGKKEEEGAGEEK
ncbi:MAG: 50S ribosomal protein L25 [Phycisphaerae bacterium]|nr:50S ribosomal protein L25 [Phycisphaerae bacterium]